MSELLDGLMLGDGCISLQKKAVNAYFRQTCKHKEYLIHLQELLEMESIPFGKSLYWRGEELNSWLLTSRVNLVLTSEHRRWYPDGTKIVPENLVLTPFVVKHWFIGDGSLIQAHDYFMGIKLATHCFTLEERWHLVSLLKEQGITSCRTNNTGELLINKGSSQDFFNYIGECPVECYSYKWNTKRFWRPTSLRRWNEKQQKLTISREA